MFEDERRLDMPGMDKDAAEAGTVVCQLLRPDSTPELHVVVAVKMYLSPLSRASRPPKSCV